MRSNRHRRVVALLPVRNGENELEGCLRSLDDVVDAVVALDDGSTDRTREILEEHPSVEELLWNESRQTAAGWDDSGNRNRLLEAAAALEPEWILSLDADERFDPEDAAALKRFIEEDALPGFAYGFRIFRMIGDLDHFDQSNLWVYRLFSFDPDHRFPSERLHFVPIPSGIPRHRWLKTTVRIQHLASITEQHRGRRFDKYAEADPDRAFQSDYSNLLAPPADLRAWEPRPPDLPVLLTDAQRADIAQLDLDAPAISVVVIAQNDEETIEASVRAIVEQECDEPFEVIVVTSGTDSTADVVRRVFPDVVLVDLGTPVLPGAARNAGLRVARGDHVSFPGSHVTLKPGALAARLAAHEAGHAMVTGSVVNGTPTRSGWASYFLDHAGSLPGRPSGPLRGPPAHCSYIRHLLVEAGGFPEDVRAGEDTVANNALYRRGHRGYRTREIELIHRSPCRNPFKLIAHHFRRGRGLGRILLDQYMRRGGLLAGRPLKRAVRRRLARTSRNVRAWGVELLPTYRRARRLVALGTASAWIGAWFEILKPGRGKRSILLRRHPRLSQDAELKPSRAR
jgi:glycosyltransferase involved in cell wall biosynthesis